MRESETDVRWHLFWAVVMVVAVIFPIVFGLFLVFLQIPLSHPVVIGLFGLDFVAIMVSWHYSLKYYRRRSKG